MQPIILATTVKWNLGSPLLLPVHRMPGTTYCFMKADQSRCNNIKCLCSQKPQEQKPLQSMGHMGDNNFLSLQSSLSSRSYYLIPSTSNPNNFFSTPFNSPSPFNYGCNGNFAEPTLVYGEDAWSTVCLMFVGYAAFTLFSEILSYRNEGSVLMTKTEKITVVKVQVGLLGKGNLLQSNLNRIAEVANTSTSEGLSSLLAETTLALLQYPNCYASAYSSVDIRQGMESGEKLFNQLSNEEQEKISKDTPVNVNNIKQSKESGRPDGYNNKYIVITILAAAEGVYKFPTINKKGDLMKALQKLGSIPSNKLLGVEVFWTPKDENETLTGLELLEDYPLLRPFLSRAFILAYTLL